MAGSFCKGTTAEGGREGKFVLYNSGCGMGSK